RKLKRVLRVDLLQSRFKIRKICGSSFRSQELFPVPPLLDEFTIVEIVLDQVIRDREEDRGFGAGIWRRPIIRVRCRVRESRVKHDQLRSVGLTVDNALRMWIEVVSGFEVCADQKYDFRVCVIRARSVETHPELIAFATAGRTDIRV